MPSGKRAAFRPWLFMQFAPNVWADYLFQRKWALSGEHLREFPVGKPQREYVSAGEINVPEHRFQAWVASSICPPRGGAQPSTRPLCAVFGRLKKVAAISWLTLAYQQLVGHLSCRIATKLTKNKKSSLVSSRFVGICRDSSGFVTAVACWSPSLNG